MREIRYNRRHPIRLPRKGVPLITFGDPRLPQRFWSKVRPNANTGCWEWTACRVTGGYGGFQAGKRIHVAHRYLYLALVGPIAPGLQVDHLCFVRHCVNPGHLEAVTPRVNVLRNTGPSAANIHKKACGRGHYFDARNTYIAANGSRKCRRCRSDAQRRYLARKAAA